MLDDKTNNTDVTEILGRRDSQSTPLMSYTAVTTHAQMANAFVNTVLAYCNKLIPDRHLNVEDIITICHAALDRRGDGVTILEGKYLRSRISEQLARAKRYKEPFALIAIQIKDDINDPAYQSVIDVFRERLRKSDVVLTFRSRIILVLPHTPREATLILLNRIRQLMDMTFESTPVDAINYLAFPSPSITRSSQVLDWAEDQLR